MTDFNPPQTPQAQLAWLQLIRSENVGPATFAGLMRRYGDPFRVLDELPDLARKGGAKRAIKICQKSDAEAEQATASKAGATFVYMGSENYPPLLAAIDQPPPVLTVRGDTSHLGARMVAMVGARNASASGRAFARGLARELGSAGLTVTSGLARGIDTAAHEGALDTGTIAVMAGGVDHVYPPQNEDLYGAIRERGAVISEMPWGVKPQARHFPRRNRIVSGLALGVVVVEAALRSGSLITARFALEQGREVFAIPGAPSDPRAAGANRLIKDGAKLTTGVDDILEELDALSPCEPLGQKLGFDEAADMPEDIPAATVDRVCELLSGAPIALDVLAREADLPVGDVAAALLELELAGRLERLPGPAFRRIS